MGVTGTAARLRAAVLLCTVLLGPGPASAEHEADHRYTILGNVEDAAGVALTGRVVRVMAGGAVIGTAKTDAEGNYRIQLHLHNADLGRQLEVQVGTATAPIRVTFDPQNARTERLHHVNFTGDGFDQEARAARAAPGWVLVLIGVVAFVVLATVSSIITRRIDRYARKKMAAAAPRRARPARAKRKNRRR